MAARGRVRRPEVLLAWWCIALWHAVSGDAFVSPCPALCSRSKRLSPARGLHMSGQGFGKRTPPPPPPPPPSSSRPPSAGSDRTVTGSSLSSWEREYKAYVKRTGKYLCSMSWEGYEEMGRGAIFANYDDAKAGGKLDDADKFGGIPSMYIPLKDFEGMEAPESTGEDRDLAQILSRVKTYSPEAEFVVVFQAAGVMGTDVVRPNVPPPEMAKYVVRQQASAVTQGPDDEGGVIDVTPLEE